MMADVALVRLTQSGSAPSSSSRHTLRVHDALEGLEPVGSGPRVSPVEPASMLDPKGEDREVPWHGCALEVDRLVPARNERRGREGRLGRDDRDSAGGAGPGAGRRGADSRRPGSGDDEYLVHDSLFAIGTKVLSFNAASCA
jgi:hypothetical protein